MKRYLLAIVVTLLCVTTASGDSEYLTNMTEDTTPESNDLLYVVDNDLALGSRRHKVQIGNLGTAAGSACVRATDCSTYITAGLLCCDTDDGNLYMGNGSAAVLQNSGLLGSTVDDTEMTAESFGDWTCTGLENGCTLNDNVCDSAAIDTVDFTCADLTTTDCGPITSSQFNGPLNGNASTATSATSATTASTATALAENAANCSAGYYARGVDASGAAEDCTAASGGGTVTNVFDCSSGDCNQMTVGTSEYLTYGTGYIDANRFAGVTTVDATEFGYLNGLSGGIYFSGQSADIPVSEGGTGAGTFTDHAILVGSGTDPLTPLAAATNGQIPIGSTGADPVPNEIDGTANEVTVTNGAGTITLSLPNNAGTDISADLEEETHASEHAVGGGDSLFPADPGSDQYLMWDDSESGFAFGSGGYTNLTSFVSQTAWRVFYSNTDGDVTELALGADGTYLKSNGPAAAPTFGTPAGGGDITTVGTCTVDDCTADFIDGSDIADDAIAAEHVADDAINAANLNAVDGTGSDEECLTRETTTGDFEWQTCGTGTVERLNEVNDPNDDTNFTVAGYEVEWWSNHDTGTREYVHLMYDLDTDKTNQTSILMIGTADTDDAEVDFIQAGDGDPQGTFNQNFAVHSDGSVWSETTVEGASVILTPADATPDEAGELQHDTSQTGFLRGCVLWHDGISARELIDLADSEGTLEPADDGHVVTYHWGGGNGYFDLTSVSGSSTTFYAEDGDTTEVAVTNANEWKFVEGAGIDIDWTDVDPGSDGDPFDLTFTISTTQVINAINPSGAMTIGDGGDTLAIDTSDWDISTTGAMTGVSGNISLWTNDSGYTTTTDQVGTLTSGDLCTNNGTTVECTVNTEAELETALDATNVIVSTEIDSAAELETLANLGAAFSDYADDATVADVLVTLGLTATASEINTPLDGALVTLTEFRELETIGDTVISANQWAAVGGMPETVTGTELGYVDGLSEALSTSLSAKAPLASPTFTGIVTVPIAADPTTDADGEMSFDTDGWASGYDALEIWNGTASAYVVATTASDTPTNGQVPMFNTAGNITWETPSGTGDMNDLVDDTSPQLGGDLDVNEYSVSLDPAPASDHTGNGLIATMTVDVNAYGQGSCLHLDSDGNYSEADADAVGTMPCSAMALETSTGSKKVLFQGFMRDDTWAWTVGGLVYVSSGTAGTLTQTAPSTTGHYVQKVGIATHADRIYFDPDLTMVKIN